MTTTTSSGNIELTAPQDIAFAAIAQRALVNLTILPSGYCTPAIDMLIIGTTLVPRDKADTFKR